MVGLVEVQNILLDTINNTSGNIIFLQGDSFSGKSTLLTNIATQLCHERNLIYQTGCLPEKRLFVLERITHDIQLFLHTDDLLLLFDEFDNKNDIDIIKSLVNNSSRCAVITTKIDYDKLKAFSNPIVSITGMSDTECKQYFSEHAFRISISLAHRINTLCSHRIGFLHELIRHVTENNISLYELDSTLEKINIEHLCSDKIYIRTSTRKSNTVYCLQGMQILNRYHFH